MQQLNTITVEDAYYHRKREHEDTITPNPIKGIDTCTNCINKQKCKTEQLSCRAFSDYVLGDKIKKKWVHIERIPSKKYFN